jgi:membrane protein DedA with SNARE-associated domain
LSLLFAGACYATSSGVTTDADHGTAALEHKFERYVARVQPLLDRYGYGIVAAAVLAEGLGIPTPGETLLLAGALEAARGRMNITWLLFLVAASATIGNTIGYAIGRWGGRAVLKKLKLNSARQQHLEEIFRRRGGIVIVLGRFLDGFRQLNGIIAGLVGMPAWSFTFYNIVGALLWTSVWGLGTYYLGRDIHAVAALFHRHRWVLYGMTATILIAVLAWLMRSSKASETTPGR